MQLKAALNTTTNGYVVHSGTSMATPFAAGAVALALQSHPAWTPAQVQAAVEATAVDFGDAGKDRDWGAGLIDVLALVSNDAATTTFPTHVHQAGSVPDGGEWNYSFELTAADLSAPIAATILLDGSCFVFWGICLTDWSPDLDAELIGPNGSRIALSQCTLGTECGGGHQETLHAMPPAAGTYRIRVYAYNGGPGGTFDLDLSTGPVGSVSPPPPPPPPTTMHVGDLDQSGTLISGTNKWTAKATVRIHDGAETLLSGAVVTGRWGTNGSVTCTTNTNGACTFAKELKRTKTSIVFRVLGVSKSSYTYVSTSNHDPDGDSNGTMITVYRP